MTFDRRRAPGGWLPGLPMTSGEIEAIDGNLANAIDGGAGGTYAPSAQIIIGGLGLRITGAFDVSGAAAFTGTVECKDGLSVTTAGSFSCSRPGSFSNGLEVKTAGSLVCSRPATFSNSIALNGTTIVDAAATFACNGDAGFAGTTLFSGDIYTNSQIQTSGLIQLTGAAKIGWRFATLTDADATISVNAYDEVRLPAVATNRTLTISNVGAIAGSRLRISRIHTGSLSGTFQLSANGGTLAPFIGVSSTQYPSIELTFDGTNWNVSAGSAN